MFKVNRMLKTSRLIWKVKGIIRKIVIAYLLIAVITMAMAATGNADMLGTVFGMTFMAIVVVKVLKTLKRVRGWI